MTALIKRKSATQSFIEDAIAGGWNDGIAIDYRIVSRDVLLDPLAWQAAGKTRGWDEQWLKDAMTSVFGGAWQFYQHEFITHLQHNKTIDEALAAISQGV